MTKLNTSQAPVTDWVAYTPTVANLPGTATGFWRRIGDSMQLRVNVTASGAATGIITVSLPSGYVMDTAKIANPGTEGPNFGTVRATDLGTGYHQGAVTQSNDTTTFRFLDDDSSLVYNAAIPFTWANGDNLTMDCEVPIVGWSSNVTMGDRAVEEYASNSSATDANDTTSFVSGPNGSVGVFFTTTLTAARAKRVRFSTAVQSTDSLLIEIQPSANGPWLPVHANNAGTIGYVSHGTQDYGIYLGVVSGTDVDVWFARYAFPGSTYGGAGVNWSATLSGYRWRVRKVSSGAMVGYPVSTANIIGATDGIAPAAGTIGEVVNFDFLSPAMPAAGTIVNAFSKTLQPGRWFIHGGVSVFGGSSGGGVVAGADDYVVVSVSSTSATENSSNRSAGRLPPVNVGAQRGTSTHGYINLAVATTIYITVRHNFTTLGTSSITQDFAPRPQAIRIC